MNVDTTLEKGVGSVNLQQSLSQLIAEVAAEEKVKIDKERELLMAISAKLSEAVNEAIAELLEAEEDSRIAQEVREEIRSGRMETIPWEQFKKELKSKQ
jgi:predicted DNA-binding protein